MTIMRLVHKTIVFLVVAALVALTGYAVWDGARQVGASDD